MYVIATVICPNFHFSVSPQVPFLNLLFEQIAIPTHIYLQNLASIQPRTSPLKFVGSLLSAPSRSLVVQTLSIQGPLSGVAANQKVVGALSVVGGAKLWKARSRLYRRL